MSRNGPAIRVQYKHPSDEIQEHFGGGFCTFSITLLHTKTAFEFLKLLSKLIRILRITFCYAQLCGMCLVNMTPVVKVVIHCIFALL